MGLVTSDEGLGIGAFQSVFLSLGLSVYRDFAFSPFRAFAIGSFRD